MPHPDNKGGSHKMCGCKACSILIKLATRNTMNEDKEKFVKEYQAKFEIHPGDLGVIAEFWLNKIKESNKALLTKLRGEIVGKKIEQATYKDWAENHLDLVNETIDQDIALIDKYIKENGRT